MVAEVGSAAPDFALSSDSDAAVRLGDFAGKPVVVYFYPKDDTSGCTKQALAFNTLPDYPFPSVLRHKSLTSLDDSAA